MSASQGPDAGGKSASPRAPATRSRRSKGEQTRRRILEAVLVVIAREGSRSVTHRAVASEAGVQLSLTTYYFKDIEAMIKEAFAQFSERMRPDLEALWAGVFEYLDGYSKAELRSTTVREAVCEQLASSATGYLVKQTVEKPTELAVEQVFFTEARLSPELRHMGLEHRRQLLAPLISLCRRFNQADPEVDAELLLNTITALEYQVLAMPPEQLDEQQLRNLLRRHIGWVLGIKRA